jgi:hypothetical protein
MYSRVQEMRNNVEEQGQFVKNSETPEIRALSDEFIALVDSLLDFIGEGVKELVDRGGEGDKEVQNAEIMEVGGGEAGVEPYDPSDAQISHEPTIHENAYTTTPMAIDETTNLTTTTTTTQQDVTSSYANNTAYSNGNDTHVNSNYGEQNSNYIHSDSNNNNNDNWGTYSNDEQYQTQHFSTHGTKKYERFLLPLFYIARNT